MNSLKEEIKILNLEKNIIEILLKNNIKYVEDLWSLKRVDLKKLNILDKEINQISINLQLIGLDLNKKIYKEK